LNQQTFDLIQSQTTEFLDKIEEEKSMHLHSHEQLSNLINSLHQELNDQLQLEQ
jgi:hypothetical protein